MSPNILMPPMLSISVNLYLVVNLFFSSHNNIWLTCGWTVLNCHWKYKLSGALQHVFAVLSLFASAVGSQATITAGFSIINQCQALDCFPRVKVVHTSEQILGQVYVPDVNWLFMALSLAITIGLHDVSLLGKATGMMH